MSGPPFRVRPASPSEIEAIVALERRTEGAPHWGREAYNEILAPDAFTGARRLLLTAVTAQGGASGISEEGCRIVGFIVVGVICNGAAGEGIAELESLAVDAAQRRAGVGRTLLDAALVWCARQGAAEINLEVRYGNRAAISLYQSLGFRQTGRRPRYYGDPVEDALLMQRSLP